MFHPRRGLRLIALATISIYCTACVATSTGSVKAVTPQASQALRTVDIVMLKRPLFGASGGSTASGYTSPGYTYYNTPSGGGGGGGGALVGAAIFAGLVGVIVVAEAMKRQREQQRAQERQSALVQAKLDSLDVEAAMERAIRANFTNLEWFRDPKFSRKIGNPDVVIENASGQTDADAVAFVTPDYVFNDDFSKIMVSLQYAMYPVSSGLRLAQGMGPGEHAPFFRTEADWEVAIPEERRGPAESNLEYWKADDGKAARKALDTAVTLAAAKLYAALTDPHAALTAETISVPREPAPAKENIFPSVVARNDWYRERSDTVTMTWPVGIFGIIRTCEDIYLIDECRAMMASAEAAVEKKQEYLIEECEAAVIVPVTPAEEPTDTATCRNLNAVAETQIAATATDTAASEPPAEAAPIVDIPKQKSYDEIYSDLQRVFQKGKGLEGGGTFIGRDGDNTLQITASGSEYAVTVKTGAATDNETVQCQDVLYNSSTRKFIASCAGIALGPRTLSGTFPNLALTEQGLNNYLIYTRLPELSFTMAYQLTSAERAALEKQAREQFSTGAVASGAPPSQPLAKTELTPKIPVLKSYDEILFGLKQDFASRRGLRDGGTFMGVDGDNTLQIAVSGSEYAVTVRSGAATNYETVQCHGVLYNPSTKKFLASCASMALGPRTLSGTFPNLSLTEQGLNNYLIYTGLPELSFTMAYQLTPDDLTALEKKASELFAAQPGAKTAAY